jgi:hypothetical protein
MVEAVRSGESMRSAAQRLNVALPTIQRWVKRAKGRDLDDADWSSRASVPHRTRRTPGFKEDWVIGIRHQLRQYSDLGEFGAAAIRREWLIQGLIDPPAVRTIGRILERRGALDGKRRVRRRAPQAGWYLPPLALGHCELDSFDVVEGLVIEGGTEVRVLNGVSLHGGLVASWPMSKLNTTTVLEALGEHWRSVGLPRFAQFDNDTLFQGNHQFADSIGRVIRLCLSLQVTPVFAPPQETGFQAAISTTIHWLIYRLAPFATFKRIADDRPLALRRPQHACHFRLSGAGMTACPSTAEPSFTFAVPMTMDKSIFSAIALTFNPPGLTAWFVVR